MSDEPGDDAGERADEESSPQSDPPSDDVPDEPATVDPDSDDDTPLADGADDQGTEDTGAEDPGADADSDDDQPEQPPEGADGRYRNKGNRSEDWPRHGGGGSGRSARGSSGSSGSSSSSGTTGGSAGDTDESEEDLSGVVSDTVSGVMDAFSDSGGSGGTTGAGGTKPPDDEEMPLTEHIDEMLVRLVWVVIAAGAVTLIAFPYADQFITQMWYDVHPGTIETCLPNPEHESCDAPHVYSPLELVLTRIRLSALAGLLVALPVAVYQTYRFMRPGLYPHERRYYLASVPFSLVLGTIGMLFAYFVMLPLLFTYFITYTEGSAEVAFQLSDTMNLVLIMMGILAVVFQIPLLIMLAIMMGITTRRWLEQRRLYFWAFFLTIAFIFGPDPTGMAPVLLTGTMVVLFEATLLLLRWSGR